MIKHEISVIENNSIAREMDITPGDFLLSINQETVRDFLDYRFKVQTDFLVVEIEKPDGEIWELDIEKDPDEDLGMGFKQSLMSETKRCCNQCIFCFIDQQPTGLRDTLYVKDDDPRMSFLLGNYVTLTNLGPREIDRLAGYHISPLRVSVHAANLDVRVKMMGTERARNLFDALDVFYKAGTELHFQIVLCKGINDGPELAYTMDVLARYKPNSLSIVPAGVTRHREGLYPLEVFDRDGARQVIRQAEKYKNFVYLSDEWYLMGQVPLPSYRDYGDFPQLENGVGVLRLFEREFKQMLARHMKKPGGPKIGQPVKIGWVTGTLAGGYMRMRAKDFMQAFPHVDIQVYEIANAFFGPTVTVSGLIVGEDVVNQLQFTQNNRPQLLCLPENAFRAGVAEKVMLDGMTLTALEAALGVPVMVGDSHGGDFCRQMIKAVGKNKI